LRRVRRQGFERLRHSFVPTPKAMADGVSVGAQARSQSVHRSVILFGFYHLIIGHLH
jgi:hypothetical protein